MLATLAAATSNEETCALIDCSDTFDPLSAARAGVDFDRLLWVRCRQQLEPAFKSTDLLLHGGGFGLVVLSLADMPAVTLRRIVSTWWFRFRRAIEDTPTVLLVMTPISCTRSCAAMALELKNEGAMWPATIEGVGGRVLGVENEHLSLVSTCGRDAHRSEVPSHAHFLASSNIRLHRERPVAWTNPMVRFTPRPTLTTFGDIR